MADGYLLEEVIGAAPEAVDALAAADPRAWQPLLEALVKGDVEGAAPGAFVDALLQKTDTEQWSKIAWDSTGQMKSAHFAAGSAPKRKFDEWFRAGVVASRPAEDPEVLRARLSEVHDAPGEDVCETARALVADIAQHAPDTGLHFEAAAVLTARYLEEGAWSEALLAAADTETAAARLPAPEALLLKLFTVNPGPIAKRLRAAALFGMGSDELEQGFQLLHSVLETPSGPVLRTKRVIAGGDPREIALRDLAFGAQYAAFADEEWLDALQQAEAAFAGTPQGEIISSWLPRFRSEFAEADAGAPAPAAAPAAPPLTPLHLAIHRLIDALRGDNLLEVEESFSLPEVTEALINALERAQSDSTEGAVAKVADALLEAPGVEELYADDETLERLLRDVFGGLSDS
jgi:hypothetical protein